MDWKHFQLAVLIIIIVYETYEDIVKDCAKTNTTILLISAIINNKPDNWTTEIGGKLLTALDV